MGGTKDKYYVTKYYTNPHSGIFYKLDSNNVFYFFSSVLGGWAAFQTPPRKAVFSYLNEISEEEAVLRVLDNGD